MPDFVSVLFRRWKIMLLLTVTATGVALLAGLLSKKMYAGTVTALPANSAVSDKARIFNQNIEALYPEVGTPDELDKIIGTAMLDTIYVSAAGDFHLDRHYDLNTADANALQTAAKILKKNTDVRRTGYGELKLKVWDTDSRVAAGLANALVQKLNDIHRRLQTQNSRMVLQRLKEDYAAKAKTLAGDLSSAADTISAAFAKPALLSQLQQYNQLINEYELALKTTPDVLLVVESASPQPCADKPDVPKLVLFSFLASVLFSFLLAVFIDGRNRSV